MEGSSAAALMRNVEVRSPVLVSGKGGLGLASFVRVYAFLVLH
jgi:hypothetical protein